MDGPDEDFEGLIEVAVEADRFRESGCSMAAPDSELTEAEALWWLVLGFFAAGG
jgi:hypothetical protein